MAVKEELCCVSFALSLQTVTTVCSSQVRAHLEGMWRPGGVCSAGLWTAARNKAPVQQQHIYGPAWWSSPSLCRLHSDCTAKPHMHHEHFIVCFGIRSTYVEETHLLFQLRSQTVSEVEDQKKKRKKKPIAVAVDSTSEDAPCESLGLITQKSTLTSFLRCLNECAWMDFLLQPP